MSKSLDRTTPMLSASTSGAYRTSEPRRLGIELRHFVALATAAEKRSFRRAADRLG